jgi:hypothetical protein
VIEFLCPNGHRIHCGEEAVGRAAKCPKCGVKFRIPDPAELEDPESIEGGSDAGRAQLTDSGEFASPREPAEPASREPQIEFLCPAGHRLHGPAGLQGRPGECPECGARFRIPNYEDVAGEEESEVEQEEIAVGRADGTEGSGVRGGAPSASGRASDSDSKAPPAAEHPLCQLLARLWALKARGATIQLRLPGGESVAVDRFARELSRGAHALVATREPDGACTIRTIPWERIEQITVAGVKELPRELGG